MLTVNHLIGFGSGDVQFQIPAYTNAGGTGDRQASITATTNLTVAQGVISNMIDGGLGYNSTDGISLSSQAWTGKYIRFDFGSPVLITEMKVYCEAAGFYNGSTSIFRGSSDASSWTTYGASVAILSDAGPLEYTELSTNVTGYRYYQIEGDSGSINIGPWMREWEFKIGNIL